MPLIGNATQVEGWELFSHEDKEIVHNYCLVLMGIGIGEVKADNVGEIVFRTRMLQGIVGNFFYGEPAKAIENVSFVNRLVGYRANVPTEAWAVWSKRVHNIHAGEYQAIAKRLGEPVLA